MGRLLIVIFACGCLGCGPAATNDASREVIFRIDMSDEIATGRLDPDNSTVGVRGSADPLQWGESIRAIDTNGDGVYEVRVAFASTSDSPVQYKFKIDGPGNPNEGWEGDPNRRIVLADSPVYVNRKFDEPVPVAPPSFTGDIRRHPDFQSRITGRTRDIWVYLPPDYDTDSERHYPVLYLHDGQNVFDHRSAGAEWRVDESAEALIASDDIVPAIIVGVANTRARMQEYTPSSSAWRFTLTRSDGEGPGMVGTFRVDGDDAERALQVRKRDQEYEAMLPDSDFWQPVVMQDDGTYMVPGPDITLMITDTTGGAVQGLLATRPATGGAAYGRFLVEELMPFVDSTYRTMTGPGNTALGGSSLGGLISMVLGARHSDVFGALLVVSPSVWWNDEEVLDIVRESGWTPGQRIWLDMGTDEGGRMLRGARRLRGTLVEAGWTLGEDLVYVEDEGASHSESAWAGRVPEMLRFLYGH